METFMSPTIATTEFCVIRGQPELSSMCSFQPAAAALADRAGWRLVPMGCSISPTATRLTYGAMTGERERLLTSPYPLPVVWTTLSNCWYINPPGEAAAANLRCRQHGWNVLLARPEDSALARQIVQLHGERLNGVVGLAHQLVEQIVLCESHLQHPGLQSREIAY